MNSLTVPVVLHELFHFLIGTGWLHLFCTVVDVPNLSKTAGQACPGQISDGELIDFS
jgi:hypothetical protein